MCNKQMQNVGVLGLAWLPVNILSRFRDFVVNGNFNEKFVVCRNQKLSVTLFF